MGISEDRAEGFSLLAVGLAILTWPVWGKVVAFAICKAAGQPVVWSWANVL